MVIDIRNEHVSFYVVQNPMPNLHVFEKNKKRFVFLLLTQLLKRLPQTALYIPQNHGWHLRTFIFAFLN